MEIIAFFLVLIISFFSLVLSIIVSSELERKYKTLRDVPTFQTIYKNTPQIDINIVEPKPKNTIKVKPIRIENKTKVKDCINCKHCKRIVRFESEENFK